MSHNTWIHRGVRLAVRPLVRTPVTPNQLTTLRLLTGLAAAVALGHGGEAWRDWGAGIFVLGLFLDRADGELARLGGKTSPWGHSYDLVSDSICNAAAFLGLGIGLRAGVFGLWAPFMGLAAGLAIAAILWLVIKAEEGHGARAAELGSAAGFDADDALLVLPAAVWLGFSDWLLLAAGLGAPAFAVYMVVRLRGLLRPSSGP